MNTKHKAKSPKYILLVVVMMLLVSGSLKLGSVGIAVASSPPESSKDKIGEISGCATDAETEKLLEMLKTRAKELSLQEAEQAERRAALEKSEADILLNLERLEAAEAKLAETIHNVSGASEKDLMRLTEVYESMKAKDSAPLFEKMSAEFAAGFLAKMSPTSAAGIMAGLSSEKAYAVSVILAGRNANAPKR